MSSTKAIKQRIRSVKNTRQITKAMEMVSAARMRKSQGYALEGRPYALASLEMLGNVLARTPLRSALLEERPVLRAVLVVVTSDKGLAGAFNSNILKRSEKWLANHAQDYPVDVVAVGKKARDYFSAKGRLASDGQNRAPRVVKEFFGFGDYADPAGIRPLAEYLVRGFVGRQWALIEIIYTNFRSTLKQDVAVSRLFPVDIEKVKETIEHIVPERGRFSEKAISLKSSTADYTYEYSFEPSPAIVLESLIPHLLEMQVFHMILESNASEHSARMVAMKNASENAGDIMNELTLQYNKQRQAGITKELTEITAGTEALGK